jgi:hypothetical protein
MTLDYDPANPEDYFPRLAAYECTADEQDAALRKLLVRYANLAVALPASYRLNETLRAGRVLPSRYLQRLNSKRAFRSGGSLEATIRRALDRGELQEVKINDPDLKAVGDRGKCYLFLIR